MKGNDNLEIIPFSVRFGFDINALVGVRGPAELQFGVEPFLNTIVAPEEGVEAGFNVGFRYITPVTDGVSIFGEISSGPAYLSIDTVEQGDGGFNFISQFGAGLQFELTRNVALNAGYRFRHLSNAGFSEPNRGINSDVLLAGISFGY
ncbi:MAG: acyloxyacyl hydrolase [Chlorobiales bacterium]|nr:acyloxyacyl hydrolase [Chlorobiales bacterium]